MTRVLSHDHVMFDECINVLRPTMPPPSSSESLLGESYSYILTPFQLTSPWDLELCLISPLPPVYIAGGNTVYINRIQNPYWIDESTAHLFGLAITTIISALTKVHCESPRDRSAIYCAENLPDGMIKLALLCSRNSCNFNESISIGAKQQKMLEVVRSYMPRLFSLSPKFFKIVMQSLRLLYLSVATKKDDFGLAYFLAIASIESIAQHAIPRDKVKEKNPSEKIWKDKAKTDPHFEELLKHYLDARGKNEYLKQRFVEYICKFCPASDWESCAENAHQYEIDYLKESMPEHNVDFLINKKPHEKYPTDFTDSQIRKILSDAYTHRCWFVHEGKQPPHSQATRSLFRYFQMNHLFEQNDGDPSILPNYELISGIAINSLLKWTELELTKTK